MRYANAEAAFVRWAGAGTLADARLGAALAQPDGAGLKWAVEFQAPSELTAAQIQSQLTYLAEEHGRRTGYLKVKGRPVVLIHPKTLDCATLERWVKANEAGVYLVATSFFPGPPCGVEPDDWYLRDASQAEVDKRPSSFCVSRGSRDFSATLDDFTAGIGRMRASGARFQLVVSFNEWNEGSAVEASDEWASDSGQGQYLDALHALP